jgi:hypothetical protein
MTDNQIALTYFIGVFIGVVIVTFLNVKHPSFDKWPVPVMFIAVFGVVAWPVFIPMCVICTTFIIFWEVLNWIFKKILRSPYDRT